MSRGDLDQLSPSMLRAALRRRIMRDSRGVVAHGETLSYALRQSVPDEELASWRDCQHAIADLEEGRPPGQALGILLVNERHEWGNLLPWAAVEDLRAPAFSGALAYWVRRIEEHEVAGSTVRMLTAQPFVTLVIAGILPFVFLGILSLIVPGLLIGSGGPVVLPLFGGLLLVTVFGWRLKEQAGRIARDGGWLAPFLAAVAARVRDGDLPARAIATAARATGAGSLPLTEAPQTVAGTVSTLQAEARRAGDDAEGLACLAVLLGAPWSAKGETPEVVANALLEQAVVADRLRMERVHARTPLWVYGCHGFAALYVVLWLVTIVFLPFSRMAR